MAKVSDRKPRIVRWDDSDDTVRIRFTRADGQRVEGMYHRFGWSQPPVDVLWKIHEAQKNGYVETIGAVRPLGRAALRQQQARQSAQEPPWPEGSEGLA